MCVCVLVPTLKSWRGGPGNEAVCVCVCVCVCKELEREKRDLKEIAF